jgi:hypothetical protein
MKTRAAWSLFALASALLVPALARAQVAGIPAEEIAPRPFEPEELAASAPPPLPQMPEPYQPPPPDAYGTTTTDPYGTAADPSQIDWPQDIAAEEASVDSYDDGYDPQAYTQFQSELAPYGDWIDDGTYGRVWIPATSIVGNDFTPYDSGGHWALTEFGWTWVSDWNWGWAPFHYGRWILVSGFGWAWVPGTMWGPAWVAWRSGGGYVGWAALPPRGVSITATYGHRTPWRFTRANDLWVGRPRTVPIRDMKGMFRRTSNVANDRVLTRGNASVHINAGPRYIPGATVARLKTVAPQTFPQRAILPRTGANMSARPWIRAATGGGGAAPSRGGGSVATGGARIGGGPGMGGGPSMGSGHAFGRSFPGHPSAAPASGPHIYNPPRPTAAAGVHAGGQPHTFAPARGNNPPLNTTTTGPRVFDVAPASNPPRVSSPAPMYGAPHAVGAPPANNPARVYNPPPRTFDTPAAVNPTRSFSTSSAGIYNPPPRTFAAPAPMQPTHVAPARSFSPPAPAPARSFSPPAPAPAPSFSAPAPARSFGAPAGGGGFGRPGGGAPLGGHRR